MCSLVASPGFVGRARELGQLDELARRAAEGEPAFVLVGGESGVGKSRLMSELSARASAAGARVLTGDCIDLGTAELPYAPLVAALRGVSGDELAAIAGRGVRELAPLLPQLEGDETVLGATSLAQGRLFEQLLALLGGLGAERPIVVIVEDAHWAATAATSACSSPSPIALTSCTAVIRSARSSPRPTARGRQPGSRWSGSRARSSSSSSTASSATRRRRRSSMSCSAVPRGTRSSPRS